MKKLSRKLEVAVWQAMPNWSGKHKKQSIEYRLQQKPLGTLVDISLRLAKCPRNTDARIAVLERLNSMFGFYSPSAQCAIFQGYIKRKLCGKSSTEFACDRLLNN